LDDSDFPSTGLAALPPAFIRSPFSHPSRCTSFFYVVLFFSPLTILIDGEVYFPLTAFFPLSLGTARSFPPSSCSTLSALLLLQDGKISFDLIETVLFSCQGESCCLPSSPQCTFGTCPLFFFWEGREYLLYFHPPFPPPEQLVPPFFPKMQNPCPR